MVEVFSSVPISGLIKKKPKKTKVSNQQTCENVEFLVDLKELKCAPRPPALLLRHSIINISLVFRTFPHFFLVSAFFDFLQNNSYEIDSVSKNSFLSFIENFRITVDTV